MKQIFPIIVLLCIVTIPACRRRQEPGQASNEPSDMAQLQEKCSDTVQVTKVDNKGFNCSSTGFQSELKAREAQFLTDWIRDQDYKKIPASEYANYELPQIELRFYVPSENGKRSVYPNAVRFRLPPELNRRGYDFQNQFSGRLKMNPHMYSETEPTRSYNTSAVRIFLAGEDAEIVKKHDLLHGFTSLLLDTDYDVYLDFDEENPDFDDLWHRIHTPAKAEPNELFVYEIDVSRGGDDPETRDWKNFEIEISPEYADEVDILWVLFPWDKRQYGYLLKDPDGIYRTDRGPSFVGTKIAVCSDKDLMFFAVVKKDGRLSLPRDADINCRAADLLNCSFEVPLPVVDPQKYKIAEITAFALYHAPVENQPLFGLNAADADITKDSISGSFKAVEGEYYARLIVNVGFGKELTTRAEIPLGMVKVEKNKPLVFPRQTYDMPEDVLEDLKYQQ